MSTREKAITLLQELPEQALDVVYAFMQSVVIREGGTEKTASAFGIAHKYANPALIAEEKGAFERAMLKKHEVG